MMKPAFGRKQFRFVSLVFVATLLPLAFNACGPGMVLVESASTLPFTDSGNPVLPNTPNYISAAFKSVPNLSIAGRCTGQTVRGSRRESVRRLTKTQLTRVLQVNFPSLFSYYYERSFPDDWQVPSYDIMQDYPADVAADPIESFDPNHTETQVLAWLAVADDMATKVANSRDELTRYGGSCITQTTITEACYKAFIENIGLHLYRRPLTAEDTQLVTAATQSVADKTGRLQKTVALMLSSPNTIFQIENGERTESDRTRLTSYEIATRIAFGATDGPPDTLLLQAAEQGKLQSLAEIRAQTERLLGSDFGRARLRHFVNDWLLTEKIVDINQDQGGWMNWAYQGNGTAIEMQREIEDYFDYVVFQKKMPFDRLMTETYSFAPASSKIASIYGGSGTRTTPGTAVDHPGLPLRVGLLASGTNLTNPIMRGVTMKRRFLCDVLPTPDFATIATRTSEVVAFDPKQKANWSHVQTLTSTTNCNSCHSLINPIGFALETYNPIGMKKLRAEYVADLYMAGPKLEGTFDLPPATPVVFGGNPAKAYNSPQEIVSAISTSQNARACMAIRFFRSIEKRPETEADACGISEAVSALGSGKSVFESLVISIANEDIFWRKLQ